MANVLKDLFITGDVGATQAYGVNWLSQTFTALTSYSVNSVKLKLYREDSPGTVTVSIRACSAGKPTGADLVVGTTNGDTTPTDSDNAEWREITFTSSCAIIKGTQYAIVIRALTGDSSNKIVWRADTTGPAYTGGSQVYSGNSGSTWTADTSKDHMFEVWGSTITLGINYSKKLVAVGNHEVWYESAAGTMAELTAANGDIDATKPLTMFEAYQKVFIVNGTNKKVIDFGNIKLQTDDILPAGKSLPARDEILTGVTSGATMIVDFISASDSACYVYGRRTSVAVFTAAENVKNTDESVYFALTAATSEVAGPHWYDWTPYANDTTTYGTMPSNPTLGCLYQGRCFLSGDANDPHQWWASGVGHPWAWLYEANNALSPVKGNNTDAGKVGDIITSLITSKDDFLIFGCANSIWYLVSNPCDGGSITELDLTTNVYGPESYCWDGSNNLYFWGSNGIYKTTVPGVPTCISSIKLPTLVKDSAIDPTTHKITMVYDRSRTGILVCITKLSDGTNSNYWLDLKILDDTGTPGMFPELYPEECGVYSLLHYDATSATYRKLLVGCADGYIRTFDDTAEDDDIGATDEAIDSFVMIGPIPLTESYKKEGKLSELTVETGGGATSGSQSDSNNVAYKLWVARTAEEIIEKFYADTGPNVSGTILGPGRRRGDTGRRKVSGFWAGIKLGNDTATETWAFESATGIIKPMGKD
ncbi:MAG: hypothetical protein IMZ53_02930 [Thermoplasmata archaeon]|nr:hypothetical protein [Thermoplasmata archaeon]